jgi:hypothetical protein
MDKIKLCVATLNIATYKNKEKIIEMMDRNIEIFGMAEVKIK